MQNSIIPQKPIYCKVIGAPHELNYKAICSFAALGFFLDKDTYWKDERAMTPATNYSLNDKGAPENEEPYFSWHYTPRNISFEDAVDEFTNLFESSINEFKQSKIILPLSGGLDSRTIACALQKNPKVSAYSYQYKNGINEVDYAAEIARVCGFSFRAYEIKRGYLWKQIDRLAKINACYAEFTHPRQMAIYDEFAGMGDVIIAGHGGDLFFDGMGVTDTLSLDEQVQYLAKKLVRKGGMELADRLWQEWGLQGTFNNYLLERLSESLNTIKIDNANARLRAFKSKYYVPRWTQVNMQVFSSVTEVFAPYFTDAMCNFICTVPEQFLKGRRIQIEYLKRQSPGLAKITWQAQRPFNLYSYHWNKAPWNLPYRIFDKVKRTTIRREFIERNWELQFLGVENNKQLRKNLFYSEESNDFISAEIKTEFLKKFYEKDAVNYSHPLSMLLTLSKFSEFYLK